MARRGSVARTYYTVHLNKTDEMIAFGTAKECAAMMGMGIWSFYNTVSRCRMGKNKKYSIVTEALDDE